MHIFIKNIGDLNNFKKETIIGRHINNNQRINR